MMVASTVDGRDLLIGATPSHLFDHFLIQLRQPA
jgi:hypothetical protein